MYLILGVSVNRLVIGRCWLFGRYLFSVNLSLLLRETGTFVSRTVFVAVLMRMLRSNDIMAIFFLNCIASSVSKTWVPEAWLFLSLGPRILFPNKKFWVFHADEAVCATNGAVSDGSCGCEGERLDFVSSGIWNRCKTNPRSNWVHPVCFLVLSMC